MNVKFYLMLIFILNFFSLNSAGILFTNFFALRSNLYAGNNAE